METNRKNIFEKGNTIWGQRSKHGRDKIFQTPSELWESACEYFQWCDDNPLIEMKPMVVSDGKGEGSSVEKVEVEKMRPYTLEGLCLYLNTNTAYFRTFKKQLVPNSVNTPELISDFNTVITAIEETIHNQLFTGAAAGFLKENLIARKLGIGDKMTNENINYNSINMTRDEIKKISDELESSI
jgi:hypothetical protein